MKIELEQWVDAHQEQIIKATQNVVQIPSVADTETVGENAPFGRAVADALEHTLALCAELGMQTENFGGYAGHAEFGSGEEIIGMLGHLDVVPIGSGWTMNPWGGEIKEGYLYGRGSADDKGPTVAALFGAKAVMDVAAKHGITLSRKIRLIFGCDEESNWKCMEHYFGAAGQPKPTYAFTPDATFPVVYAEKGSFTAVVERVIPTVHEGVRLEGFSAGMRPNMVPDEAFALFTGESAALQKFAESLAGAEGIRTEYNGDVLYVFGYGKSAHAARPFLGVNAATLLMNALTDAYGVAPTDAALLCDAATRSATDGSTVGIAGKDEITTPLTSNLGIVMADHGVMHLTFNIRYPATWDGAETIQKFTDSLATTGWKVIELHHTPALYVPPTAEPVTTLLRVYRECTGDMQEPRTMGGRTYATTVAPIGVAFGAALPGDPEVAHQADERFSVERLILCAKIYAYALWELAK